MSKSWVSLAFLPFLVACAGTLPGAMAEKQCRVVAQDNTDSHIKVKNECASPADASAVDPLHHSETRPAPQ
jgi:hypothetical protein